MLPLVLSSDSHVFEPPDLWQTRIDRAFRDRAPRIQRLDGADQIVIEADQILSGIGLISNAGARFEAPETIAAQGRFEDVHRGGYDPSNTSRTCIAVVAAPACLSDAQRSQFANRPRHLSHPHTHPNRADRNELYSGQHKLQWQGNLPF